VGKEHALGFLAKDFLGLVGIPVLDAVVARESMAPRRSTGTNGGSSAVANESANLLPGEFISVPTMTGK